VVTGAYYYVGGAALPCPWYDIPLVTGGSVTTTAETEMPKPKGRPKKSERNDRTVKVDQRIVGKAELIAKHQGVSLAELLSTLLEAPVDKAYLQMLRELEKKA
jgi:hypothetical protein